MRRTILLADDSPTIHRLVNNTFADADFEIVSVSNGEAAVRKFEEIHPHVVLADIYMPGRTGYEVCTYIRQHPTVSNTPVILLVGAFDVFDENRAQEIGATGHITKPFEPRALFSLVESVLPPEEVALDETAIEIPGESTVLEKPIEVQVQTTVQIPVEVPVLTTEDSQPREYSEVAAKVPDVMDVSQHVSQENLDPTAAEPQAAPENQDEDLLGLASLFPETPAETPASPAVTEIDIDRIADRVIKRLSSEVIESIAWELVPEIAEKVVREELRRRQ